MKKFKRNISNTIFQGINRFSVANELKHERQTAIGCSLPVMPEQCNGQTQCK